MGRMQLFWGSLGTSLTPWPSLEGTVLCKVLTMRETTSSGRYGALELQSLKTFLLQQILNALNDDNLLCELNNTSYE